jgi:simple sugar transport system permease protein
LFDFFALDSAGLTPWISLMASTIRVAIPLICACLAGFWSERSGIVDIGLEGKLLLGAFSSAVVAHETGSPWLALTAALIICILFALLHGFAAVRYQSNQVVSGIAINMMAVGLTGVMGQAWYGQGGRTPMLSAQERFLPLVFGDRGWLEDWPILGSFYRQVISGHSILTYITLISVVLIAFIAQRTRFGLRIRAAGENPNAVDTSGISVVQLRLKASLLGGLLCGVGGSYLALTQSAGFTPLMTAGKGFIALAALIFAKWRVWPAFATCILFGFLEASEMRLQGVTLWTGHPVPVQLIQSMPYVLTLIILAGFMGRSIAPRALGIPYEREKRWI